MRGNFGKWFFAILISFAIGTFVAFTDAHVPTVWDLVRHGGITCVPTLTALQIQLKKDLGVDG